MEDNYKDANHKEMYYQSPTGNSFVKYLLTVYYVPLYPAPIESGISF